MNIANDPARRIRRIQRLKMLPGERFTEAMGCVVCSTLRAETIKEYSRRRLREMRLAKAATFSLRELDWICSFALDTHKRIDCEERNCRELDNDIEIERDVLTDVKAWSSETINELRSQLKDAQKAHESCDFYASVARHDMGTMRQTIAEQKAQIEELEKQLGQCGH